MPEVGQLYISVKAQDCVERTTTHLLGGEKVVQ